MKHTIVSLIVLVQLLGIYLGIVGPAQAVSSTVVQAVSDGYGGVYWNTGTSSYPAIAVGPSGVIHVVWDDSTNGRWGTDDEVIYANYTPAAGWSNASVVSDGYGGMWWNTGNSVMPDIAVDAENTVHVVWQDGTVGWWGIDQEIMYANYTSGQGWSNATVISDDKTLWNSGTSLAPAIAVGPGGVVHTVWCDQTDGPWGTDSEIMYSNYTPAVGWSKPSVISDDWTHWNTGSSLSADIALDAAGNISVVWGDYTSGVWGGGSGDAEIMWTHYANTTGWSKPVVISDGYNGSYWNTWTSGDPAVSTGSDGSIHVVWDDIGVEYAQYRPERGWSNASLLSSYGTDPDVAVDGTLAVHVAWAEDTTTPTSPANLDVWYQKWSPGSGWGAIRDISNDASRWSVFSSWQPAIAVDASNAAHIVWSEETLGVWGGDPEILYYKVEPPQGDWTIYIVVAGCAIGGVVVGVFLVRRRQRLLAITGVEQ